MCRCNVNNNDLFREYLYLRLLTLMNAILSNSSLSNNLTLLVKIFSLSDPVMRVGILNLFRFQFDTNLEQLFINVTCMKM